MDAIKKKMQSLKSETDNAALRAEELDKEAKEATQRAEKYEENVRETKHLLFSDRQDVLHCRIHDSVYFNFLIF